MSSSLITTRRSALHQTFRSSAATPSLVRRTLRVWMTEREVDEVHREDLLLAVNEAVTNVVDHAYRGVQMPGCVEVDIELTHERDRDGGPERWATIAVTDYGIWRSERADRGFRGRGLRMIQACTDWRHVERRAGGTRVTMVRRID